MLRCLQRYPGPWLVNCRRISRRCSVCSVVKHDRATVRASASEPVDDTSNDSRRLASILVSALASFSILLSSSLPSFAADSLTIRFRVSRNPEIRSAQELLVQTWGYVSQLYYDPTYNDQDWDKVLQTSLDATFKARSRDEALEEVDRMLQSLGDPFTRVLLPGGASEAFRAVTESKLLSTGLRVDRGPQPDSPLRVSYVFPGFPAAEAGLQEGDEVVAINGHSVPPRGKDASTLEELRRDKEVTLKIRRRAAEEPAGLRFSPEPAPVNVVQPLSARGLADAALPSGISRGGRSTAVEELEVPGGSPAVEAQAGGGKALDAEQRVLGEERAAGGGGDAAAAAVVTSELPISRTQDAPSTSYRLPGRFIDVQLRPVPIEFVPVQYAVLTKKAATYKATSRRTASRGGGIDPPVGGSAAAGLASAAGAGGVGGGLAAVPPSASRVGYIRIVSFSDGVSQQVEAAVTALQAAGCGSWLLDVRANPGGLVSEGLSVAELLMRPEQVFAVVQDRSGEEIVERLSDSARALVAGQPVAVLVDRDSASTSELLAAALHDDEPRALLLGERTYGKGHTQRVVPLYGGAILLVSVDTYLTPARRVVDRVGLPPDVACRPGPPPALVPRRATLLGAATSPEAPLRAASAASSSTAEVSPAARSSLAGPEPRLGETDGEGLLGEDQVEGLLRDPCVRAAVGKLARGAGQGRRA